jgi:hypothetical protein
MLLKKEEGHDPGETQANTKSEPNPPSPMTPCSHWDSGIVSVPKKTVVIELSKLIA